MVGKAQAKLSAGHHGFVEAPVVAAHGPPALDPVHVHLHLHHPFFGAASAGQAHLQWSGVCEGRGRLRRGELRAAGLETCGPGHDTPLLWLSLLCKARPFYQIVPNVPACSRNLTECLHPGLPLWYLPSCYLKSYH